MSALFRSCGREHPQPSRAPMRVSVWGEVPIIRYSNPPASSYVSF
jgi:hypothetical protein